MATSSIYVRKDVAERKFYSGMALAMMFTVFLGFSRSFFLRPLFPDHVSPAEPIFYFHGMVFTAWMLLFIFQVTLIGKGNAQLHRKIGSFAAILVVVMVILGVKVALTAAARPDGFTGIPIPGLQFLAIPMFNILLFPLFVIIALIWRNRPQSHKRLMLLATLNLITAAIARWPIVGSLGPIAYFAITDLFIVALAIWDYKSIRRIHPVTLWGGLVIIISKPLSLVVSGTALWMSFAQWATGVFG